MDSAASALCAALPDTGVCHTYGLPGAWHQGDWAREEDMACSALLCSGGVRADSQLVPRTLVKNFVTSCLHHHASI